MAPAKAVPDPASSPSANQRMLFVSPRFAACSFAISASLSVEAGAGRHHPHTVLNRTRGLRRVKSGLRARRCSSEDNTFTLAHGHLPAHP
jgi:hypothetical protein